MKKSGQPIRKTPLRKRNAKRHAKDWLRQFGSEERVEKIRALPCIVRGCPKRSKNCHTHSRRTATWRDIYNACDEHHRFEHDKGIETFAATFGVDPWAQAAYLAETILP